MKGVVLAYHSHHVVGNDYARNDHIALPADLELITDAGCKIVSLDTLVDAFFNVAAADSGGGERKLVAITFDDGPIYDVEDFIHPEFRNQRSFLGIMRDFVSRRGETAQSGLSATSFVIASPDARRVIEATYDAAYTYTGPGSMTDEWWNPAIDTGLISIANHSWDHLHPGLPTVAHSGQGRFHADPNGRGCRCANRRCMPIHRSAHGRQKRSVLCLSVRALQHVSDGIVSAVTCTSDRTARRIYD
jgi:peptidoglycan/xylan/chitin deacetylase (PgdA/CDA1 family)